MHSNSPIASQKHADGDLKNGDPSAPKVLKWGKSAAKQHLEKRFGEKAIATDHKAPQQVWKDHCKNHAAFAGMKHNEAFDRRLNTARNDHIEKRDRMRNDSKACTKAKKNHPTPELNARGELQWNGSIAQKMLKETVQNREHKGVDPSVTWTGKAEFKVHSKQTFRDHICQEERLLKFDNCVAGLRKEKFEKLQCQTRFQMSHKGSPNSILQHTNTLTASKHIWSFSATEIPCAIP